MNMFGVEKFRVVLVSELGDGSFKVTFAQEENKLFECNEKSSITVQTAQKRLPRISLDTENEVDFNPKIDLRSEKPFLFTPVFLQDVNTSLSRAAEPEQSNETEQGEKVIAVLQLQLKGAKANYVDVSKKDYDELYKRYTKISIDINVVMRTLGKAVNYLVRK
jgi:hypothetical protein